MATRTANQAVHGLRRDDLDVELLEFQIDRQSRNLTPKTLRWYERSLAIWRVFLRSQGVDATAQVNAALVRRFLLYLTERGHGPGVVCNIFGAVKAFPRWYCEEDPPPGWQDPLRRVSSPKRPEEPLEPVSLADVRTLLATCRPRTPHGDRDPADAAASARVECAPPGACRPGRS
jgi:site-specific recombinase XerD